VGAAHYRAADDSRGRSLPGGRVRGSCPGIDPVAFGSFRRRLLAEFERVDIDVIHAAVTAAIFVLQAADTADIPGCPVRDLRTGAPISQLPEAALSTGYAYVTSFPEMGRDRVTPTGNHKVVLGGHTTPDQVRAFLAWAATQPGLAGSPYGDPVRGFAGFLASAK
jgi:hypothetical protein